MISPATSLRRVCSSERLGFQTSTAHPKAHPVVPDELTGAYNAFTSSLARTTRTVSDGVAATASAAIAAGSGDPPGRFENDLDFQAHLRWPVQLLCWVIPPTLLFVLPAILATSSGSVANAQFMSVLPDTAAGSPRLWYHWILDILRVTAKTVLCAGVSLFSQYQLLQRQYAARQRDATELGDQDSKFESVCDIKVHYKSTAPARPALAVALYHGFGANLWSWRLVQQTLSRQVSAVVTSHDMPGFGLTQRSKSGDAYTLRNNGDIGRRVQEVELAKLGLFDPERREAEKREGIRAVSEELAQAAADKRASASRRSASVPRVLVGHSLGCAGIAESFVADPSDVDAIILVAPAIMSSPFAAPPKLIERRLRPTSGDGGSCMLERYEVQPEGSSGSESSNDGAAARASQPSFLARAALSMRRALASAAAALTPLALTVTRPVLLVVLRGLVRNKAFWQNGLTKAYADAGMLLDRTVYYYRLPALARGWEDGILRFLRARLSSRQPPTPKLATATRTTNVKDGRPLLDRFKERLEETGVPVLILHGEQDRLVPISNSCRVSAVLGVPLVKISSCGHTPAEETPQCFTAEVTTFLRQLDSKKGGRSSQR